MRLRSSVPLVAVGALALGLAGVATRCVVLQGLHRDDLARGAEAVYEREETTGIPRGDILDRAGRPLAISRPTVTLVSDPKEVSRQHDPEAVARLLAPLLGRSEAFVLDRLRGAARYRVLRRALSAEEATRIESALARHRLVGFRFEEEYRRAYPQGEVACHVVGFADRMGTGRYGLEARFDADLRGEKGSRSFLRLPGRRGAGLATTEPERPPSPGSRLRTTIDGAIASFAAEELDRIEQAFRPAWATVLVLDPIRGDVLALEATPRFDPNRYEQESVARFTNPALSFAYSPGSAFKPFVLAGAFAEGLVRDDEVFHCEDGEWRVGRRTVRDHHPYGALTVRQILALSSNVGMSKIGLRLGCARAERWVRAFDFGRRTGIELPGEAAGRVTPSKRWSETYTLVSVSFGYEISCSPLRLAASFAAFANGGWLVAPRIVDGIERQGGAIEVPAKPAPRRAIPPETHAIVADLLEEVMVSGTGKRSASARVRLAGKTGTTKKERGGGYTSTFVGYGPVEAPRALCLVVVERPQGGLYYGGDVAAPSGVRVLERALDYLGPSYSSAPPEAPSNREDGLPWRIGPPIALADGGGRR